MRRSIKVVMALLLLVGCSAAVEKRGYLLGLITLCAQVNEALDSVAPSEEPGRFATELQGLVGEARTQPAPQEDRETLQQLLGSFEQTAARFEAAQEALARGNETAATSEVEAAQAKFQETSEVAQDYGMPPLSECDEYVAGESVSPRPDPTGADPSPAPSEASPSATPSSPSEEPADVRPVGWRRLTDARTARQQVAVAEVNGLIYVAGGIEGRTATRRVDALDTAVDSWRSAPDLPIPLHHAMAVNYRGELVVLGGWQPVGDDLNATVSDRVFALRSKEWVDLQPLPHPRAAGAATVVDDHIVVVGGQAHNVLIADTDVYYGPDEGWRDGADLPTPREKLAAASDGRYVYAVGGRELTSASNRRSMERYDPMADEWVEMARMPTARGSIDGDVVDGRLVIVGGETPTGVLSRVEAYDIASDTWSAFPPLSVPRHGPGVATIGSVIFALHGAEGPSYTASSAVVEALQVPPRPLQPTAWRRAKDALMARQQVAVAEVGGVIWVAGGLQSSNVATSAVHGFDPAAGQWREAEDLPLRLHHAMAVNYRGELVVLGGWVGGGPDPTAEVSERVFVLRGGGWEELAPLNHRRAAGLAAVVDDQIVVAGGQAEDGVVAPTEVYDGEAEEWRVSADIPTPREHLAGSEHGGYLYAVGGRDLTPDSNSAVLERYDPDADRWQTMAPMPTTRGSIGAAVVEDRLVVVSGETSTDVLGVVEMYDFSTDKWARVPDLPTPRHGPGVASLGSALYVINGAGSTSHTDSTTVVEVLDFE